MTELLAFIDFETTGLSPDQGDRVIEVGVVLLEGARIVDSYQSLIHPGMAIPGFIQSYTGITNDMVRHAPNAATAMRETYNFIGSAIPVAHNASFDRKFMDAELARLRLRRQKDFICSLRVARRVYPRAPNHKLGTLVAYAGVEKSGQFHRALGDAQMTAGLWTKMAGQICRSHGIQEAPPALMACLQGARVAHGDAAISRYLRRAKLA